MDVGLIRKQRIHEQTRQRGVNHEELTPSKGWEQGNKQADDKSKVTKKSKRR